MKYTIIKTRNNKTTKEIVISGNAFEVKSKVGKEFNADKSLVFVQVLEEKFSILILQKNPETGKMINRFSA